MVGSACICLLPVMPANRLVLLKLASADSTWPVAMNVKKLGVAEGSMLSLSAAAADSQMFLVYTLQIAQAFTAQHLKCPITWCMQDSKTIKAALLSRTGGSSGYRCNKS